MKLKKLSVIMIVVSLFLTFGGFSAAKYAFAGDTTVYSQFLQKDSGFTEQPVAPEKNPPGDIPDSQVFIRYASQQGGYELDVPEGWARRTKGENVIFTSKLDGLSAKIADTGKIPDVKSVGKDQAEQLKRTKRAVIIRKIKSVKLKGGKAVCIVYESNSEPDSVTGKQVRLENETYFYCRNNRVAELRLWAPLGADNVDQWVRVSNSFRWR